MAEDLDVEAMLEAPYKKDVSMDILIFSDYVQLDYIPKINVRDWNFDTLKF